MVVVGVPLSLMVVRLSPRVLLPLVSTVHVHMRGRSGTP
jgi:hypothetical protein